MNDAEIVKRIGELTDEEHQLEQGHVLEPLGPGELERLRSLEVALDQCWDLLRQRSGQTQRRPGSRRGEGSSGVRRRGLSAVAVRRPQSSARPLVGQSPTWRLTPRRYDATMRAVMLDVPESLLDERRRQGLDVFDEVWEGVLHMVPPPSGEHQRLELELGSAFLSAPPSGGGWSRRMRPDCSPLTTTTVFPTSSCRCRSTAAIVGSTTRPSWWSSCGPPATSRTRSCRGTPHEACPRCSHRRPGERLLVRAVPQPWWKARLGRARCRGRRHARHARCPTAHRGVRRRPTTCDTNDTESTDCSRRRRLDSSASERTVVSG